MGNLLSVELHGNGLSGEMLPLYNLERLQLLNLADQYGETANALKLMEPLSTLTIAWEARLPRWNSMLVSPENWDQNSAYGAH